MKTLPEHSVPGWRLDGVRRTCAAQTCGLLLKRRMDQQQKMLRASSSSMSKDRTSLWWFSWVV